jgi:uridine kinase
VCTLNEPSIIGIAGGSGAGKTFLAEALMQRLHPLRCQLIPQDSYYKGLPAAASASLYNFDHPDAVDWDLLKGHVRMLRSSSEVLMPRYDFQSHRRVGYSRVPEAAVYLIEGTMVFVDQALREMMSLRVYVDEPESVRLARRLDRDALERGRDRQAIVDQYEKTVAPMFEKFVAGTRDHADLVVTSQPIDVVAKLVADRVRRLRSKE